MSLRPPSPSHPHPHPHPQQQQQQARLHPNWRQCLRLPLVVRLKLRLSSASCALLLAAAGATGAANAGGCVLVIGGALQDDNTAIWSRFVQLAGGAGAPVAVLATASANPDAAAAQIAAVLARHGANGRAVRVAPMLAPMPGGPDAVAAAHDARWVQQIDASQGAFLSGGDQARLMDTLQPGGRPTPVLQALRRLLQRGGVVAGTSAGAAVLSAVAFRDAPDVPATMQTLLRPGQDIDRGFALLPPELAVDQHFIRRGRIGRLLALMQQQGLPLGLGVEEDSAAAVCGRDVEVLGRHGVLWLDLRGAQAPEQAPEQARAAAAAPLLRIHGARLSWLRPGDHLNLDQGGGMPAAGAAPRPVIAVAAAVAAAEPALPVPEFADLLSPGVLPLALQAVATGGAGAVRGRSVGGPATAAAAGFDWNLRADARTRFWTREPGAGAQADTSVADVLLDVQPLPAPAPAAGPAPALAPASAPPAP